MLPSAFLSIPLYYTPRSIRFSSSSNGACLFCSLASPCRYRSNLFVARSQRCCRPASNLSLLISSSSSSQEASENNDNAADKQHNDEESSSTPEESPDILQSPSFLKRKLELVQQELDEAKKEMSRWEQQYDDQKEAYVRLVADFENYRKRMNKEKQDIAEVTKANVIRELVAVLDNFDRAAAAIVVNTEGERKIHESYQALAKQLLDALTKLNVEPIDAVGQPFNPNLHEAVNRVDSTDHEEGVVAMQYQRGYKIGDRLVRPALCVVSSGPGPSKKEQTKEEEKPLDNGVNDC